MLWIMLVAKRFLVFFLYLNDNEGGLTSFPEYDTMIQPKAGTLLMFPPLWTHKHIGHKPIKKPKYIIGSYLHYAMNDRIEHTILNNLFFNEDFTRKAIPFLKEHYFPKRDEKILFSEVEKFLHKYNNLPTKESILIELNNRKDLNEEEYKNVKDLVASISQ